MFHVQDPRYESLVLQALGSYLVESCLARSLSLGSALRTSSLHHTSTPPVELGKHAPSQSASYVMKQCRQLLDKQRDTLKRPQDADGTPVSADATLKLQRQQVLRRLLDQIVGSEDTPSVKLSQLQAMTFDAVQEASPDWLFVTSLLSASLALAKLEFGDWAERVAHAELDLALCYTVLHNFEMAVVHADNCAAVLQNIVTLPEAVQSTVGGPSTHVWLQAKNNFVAAAARSMSPGSPKGSLKRLKKAVETLLGSPSQQHDASTLFACRFVELCCVVAKSKTNDEHHQAVCDALAAALECSTSVEWSIWVYCAALSIHLPLLLAADEELRDLGISSVRQKLSEEVRDAPSKKDLEDVSLKLKSTLAALSEKSNALQLCIVRQVDAANKHFCRMFEAVAAWQRPLAPRVAASANVLRYAWLRCLAVGLRRQECDNLASAVVRGLSQSFADQHVISACAFLDVGSALSSNDICRMSSVISAQEIMRHILSDPVHRTMSSEQPGDLPRQDDDEADSDDDVEHAHLLRRSVDHYERGIQQLLACNALALSFARWPVVSMSIRQMTVILFRLQDTKKELRWLSVLAALAAETLGPTHAETAGLLKLVKEKQHRVHAPLFSPSWGVQQLLTNVTLTCDTAGAEIYFSVTDSGRGQGSSGPYLRYTAPIQLDRVGRVCIRAYATKDDLHSGVVEARFSVVHRSAE